MAKQAGFALRYHDIYALSLFTSADSRGQQNLFVQTPGHETRAHGYVPAGLSGTTVGCALRDLGLRRGSTGQHVLGEEFARASLAFNNDTGVAVQLAAAGLSSVLSSLTVDVACQDSSRSPTWVDLPDSARVELSFSYVPSGYSSTRTDEIVFPWSAELPGVVLCKISVPSA